MEMVVVEIGYVKIQHCALPSSKLSKKKKKTSLFKTIPNFNFLHFFFPFTLQPSVVKISNVHYINIKGTTRSQNPVNFECSPKYPCDNIQLFNIDLKSTSPKAISVCTNAKAGYAGVQNPTPACH